MCPLRHELSFLVKMSFSAPFPFENEKKRMKYLNCSKYLKAGVQEKGKKAGKQRDVCFREMQRKELCCQRWREEQNKEKRIEGSRCNQEERCNGGSGVQADLLSSQKPAAEVGDAHCLQGPCWKPGCILGLISPVAPG